MSALYLTAALPYVNGAPHLGHALECVQADALARHARAREPFGSRAAPTTTPPRRCAPRATQASTPPCSRHASATGSGRSRLRSTSRTTTSCTRRATSVTRRRYASCGAASPRTTTCTSAEYDGLYCAGCEQYFTADELDGRGTCGEHAVPATTVHERNWFFRLSRHARALRDAIESGRLRILPEHQRNAVLTFLRGDVRDLSVSRDATRTGGWGIAVPGDRRRSSTCGSTR